MTNPKFTLELTPVDNMPTMRIGKKRDGSNYSVRTNRDRFFYPKEWNSFYDNLKDWQKFYFLLLFNTGARINEARNIKVGDIDLENKRLILRVTKTKAKKGEKNPRPRTIPISSQFAKVLKNYIKEKNLNNESYLGVPPTSTANVALSSAVKRAGIKDWYMFSIHNIRKTFETWLIALNVNEVKISRHMGHDITTAIQHYVSPDVFSWEEKDLMRRIIGDLYSER